MDKHPQELDRYIHVIEIYLKYNKGYFVTIEGVTYKKDINDYSFSVAFQKMLKQCLTK